MENGTLIDLSNFELVKSEVEIYEDFNSDDGDLFDVYLDRENEIFYAKHITNVKVLKYVPRKPLKEISKLYRDRILEYCLGQYYPDTEQVSSGDIFLQGEFVDLVK